MKLMKMTETTFIITTKGNIDAAYHLQTETKLSYVYKHFSQKKFWKSSLAKRGKEMEVTFNLILAMSQ